MHTRKILLLTVLLLMTPALALASTARLEGLGVIPDFVEDYANMFTYPVSITRYPGVVIGELGMYGSWDRGFGATMGLGQDNAYGVFGLMLRENSNFAPVPNWSGTEGSQFDVLWGMNFGKASLGVRFDNSSSSYEEVEFEKFSPLYFIYVGGPDDIVINDMNSWGLGLSVGMDVRETDKLEAAFEYRMVDFSVDFIPTPSFTWEDKGNASIGFTGRGFFTMAENISLVPLVGYNKYDFGWQVKAPDVPDAEDSADQTLTNMRAGLGLKVDVGSWFMMGLGFSQSKMEVDQTFAAAAPPATNLETFTFTSTAAPFLFGCLETEVKDWLTVRFGAKKNLVNEETELTFVGPGVESIEFKTKNGLIPDGLRSDIFDATGLRMPYFNEPFMFSLGVGFKFGDLDIDATMNDFYPFTGMYWLSGVEELPFTRISATYHY
jgi:hypothetical protein